MCFLAKTADGETVWASQGKPNQDCFCPDSKCNERLVYVAASNPTRSSGYLTERLAHFRHRPESKCALANLETARHMAMKQVWLDAFPDVTQTEVNLPSGRRADLVITDPRGFQRAVECQYSDIEFATVGGRITDHTSDGLYSLWSFAPRLLPDKKLSVYDGAFESLSRTEFRALTISSWGEVNTSYAFFDISHWDEPLVVPVATNLSKDPLIDRKDNRGNVTMIEGKSDAELAEVFKRKRLNYWDIAQKNTIFIAQANRFINIYGNEDQGKIWRDQLREYCNHEAGRVVYPLAVPTSTKPNPWRGSDSYRHDLERVQRDSWGYVPPHEVFAAQERKRSYQEHSIYIQKLIHQEQVERQVRAEHKQTRSTLESQLSQKQPEVVVLPNGLRVRLKIYEANRLGYALFRVDRCPTEAELETFKSALEDIVEISDARKCLDANTRREYFFIVCVQRHHSSSL